MVRAFNLVYAITIPKMGPKKKQEDAEMHNESNHRLLVDRKS